MNPDSFPACSKSCSAPTGSLVRRASVPGLTLVDNFLSVEDEAAHIRHINAENLAPFRFQQWEAKRLTRAFGYSYDFQKGKILPDADMPPWLALVRDQAALAAGLDPADLVQALLIYYAPGAGIGWHRDRPVFDHVIGISLGSAAMLRMRRRSGSSFARVAVKLDRCSLYHLQDQARDIWEHSIAPVSKDRWSITFRSLRPCQI